VRAFVRKTSDREKVERLKSLGCEIVTGDLQDKPSLERACKGIDVVVSTATTTISRQPHDSLDKTDLQGLLNLIEAAERNDVKRFVLVSFSGNLEGDSKLHRAKRTVEEKLRESGISYTILRPSVFMELWLSAPFGFDPHNKKTQIFGDRPISYISLFDVAEFAVRATTDDAMANKTIELGGTEALTPGEVVKIFEREFGGPFQVTKVPEEALKQQYAAASEEYQKTIAGLMLAACGGDSIDMRDTLKRFTIKLTSVRDYARRMTQR
jgi:uncharacterized protein YbjT (DUF2867 family)